MESNDGHLASKFRDSHHPLKVGHLSDRMVLSFLLCLDAGCWVLQGRRSTINAADQLSPCVVKVASLKSAKIVSKRPSFLSFAKHSNIVCQFRSVLLGRNRLASYCLFTCLVFLSSLSWYSNSRSGRSFVCSRADIDATELIESGHVLCLSSLSADFIEIQDVLTSYQQSDSIHDAAISF